MRLTSYRCDYCDAENDEPAYTLSDRTSGNDLHFCNDTCLVNHILKKAANQKVQTLAEAIEEWKKFGGALRAEDRDRFLQMLAEAEPLARAMLSSGEGASVNEAIFLAALLIIRGEGRGALRMQRGLSLGEGADR